MMPYSFHNFLIIAFLYFSEMLIMLDSGFIDFSLVLLNFLFGRLAMKTTFGIIFCLLFSALHFIQQDLDIYIYLYCI